MDDAIVSRVAAAIRGEINRQWSQPTRVTANLDAMPMARVALEACGMKHTRLEMLCRNCQFFDGVCRRHAPLAGGRNDRAEWRAVAETDWCGEFAVGNAAIARALVEERRAAKAEADAQEARLAADREAERIAQLERDERNRRARMAAELARLEGEARETARKADVARRALEAEQKDEAAQVVAEQAQDAPPVELPEAKPARTRRGKDRAPRKSRARVTSGQ